MTFSTEQTAALASPLDKKHVTQRDGRGTRKLSYIEGWHAIAEANRIFGFDGWTRETVGLTKVQELLVGDKSRVAYICKVRIEAGGIVREGSGYGQGLIRISVPRTRAPSRKLRRMR